MHRSGTSMVTRGLHEAGLTLLGSDDSLIEAADDNPEGFWENKRIVACNDELLEAAGGAWDNPPPLLPQAIDDPRFAAITDRAIDALASLRHHDHWGFKDPRTCLTAGVWLDLEAELRFVVCVRHPLEVALSLRQRNQTSYSLGLALWERYYEAALATIPDERRIVTHYDTYFVDPQGEFDRLCRFARLEPVAAPVRTELRHHTIGVSLTDAGLSSTLIELYRRLCDEAGQPQPPEQPSDEGRVHRLVLDGAVAERHAAQRQDAIERLEARELEFRAQIDDLRRQNSALESDLRNRLHRVEAQLAATKKVAISRDDIEKLTDGLARDLRRVEEATTSIAATVPEMDTVLRHTAGRVEVVADNTRLGPLRRLFRRGTTLAYRGGRRYAFRPTRVAAQRGGRAALPRAKAAARTLPPEAQQILRQGRRRVYRTRRRLSGAPPAVTNDLGATPAAPDEPRSQPELWLPRFEAMVARAVPGEAKTLVIDREGVLATAVADRFPRTDGDDLAAIAELETRRHDGYTWLTVTDGSRHWLNAHRSFGEHLLGHYVVVDDQPGAGLAVDISRRTEDGGSTLKNAITMLTSDLEHPPAVLDWTDLDIGRDLTGLTVFGAPEGDSLPYLDSSVDIVVADRARDRGEAARVASVAVMTVEEGPAGVAEVHTIEAQSELDPIPMPPTLLIGDASGTDQRWRDALTESGTQVGATVHFADLSAGTISAMAEIDSFAVLVFVEAGVVPLPGSIEVATAAATVGGHAVTGKVVRGDGELESAGATVFADRSVGLIGAGTTDLQAPWHDFTRPVCWGVGMVAAPTALVLDTLPAEHLTGRAFLREWGAHVWERSGRVDYASLVAAVRVAGDGGEPSGPLHETAWQRVLDLRPTRPTELDDGAWRYVLAHDDVEACRG